MSLRCMNIEKRMRTSKYRAFPSLLLLTFVGVAACKLPDETRASKEWIGFNSRSTFEIRTFPHGRVVPTERAKMLNQRIKRLQALQHDACRAARFTVIGDSRAAFDGLGTSIYWPAMLAQMDSLTPEVILHVGDLVKNGRDGNEWMTYLSQLPHTTPLIPVRGNHDRGDFFYESGVGVAEVFQLDIGSARIFGLDSEGGPEAVMARLPRLEKLLAKKTNRWKIVYLHRPIWSQGLHGSDELGLNDSLVTLFDAHNVVLVLSGHDHNYERFCPTRGTSANRTCTSFKEGTTYVVTGGGATMPNSFPAIWRRYNEDGQVLAETSRSFSGALHFIELDVTPSKLTFRAHASDFNSFKSTSSVFDVFSIEREVTPCL